MTADGSRETPPNAEECQYIYRTETRCGQHPLAHERGPKSRAYPLVLSHAFDGGPTPTYAALRTALAESEAKRERAEAALEDAVVLLTDFHEGRSGTVVESPSYTEYEERVGAFVEARRALSSAEAGGKREG